ncbi:MAG TPA: hypothetical protein VGR25_10725 [bacterium]|nr:hypothetical protein [bacterium]
MQLVELKVPDALLPQLTDPVGVLAVPVLLSVTVAVHVLGALTGTEAGAQLTAVVVERVVAVRLNCPLLPEWLGSPP